MTFLQKEYTVRQKRGHRSRCSEELALGCYLENRPLKKALTLTCGLGIIPAFRYRKSILLYLWKNINVPSLQSHIQSGGKRRRATGCLCVPLLVPGFDLLSSSEHGLCRTHVQVQQVHPGIGVGGQEGSAGSLGPLHVPAGQTEPQLAVLGQQPLAQRQADAAAESDRWQTDASM